MGQEDEDGVWDNDPADDGANDGAYDGAYDDAWGDPPDAHDHAEPDDAYDDDPLAQLAAASDSAPAHHGWQGRGPALDAYNRIDADIHCTACGYNLRGQSIDGTCPECGQHVAWSARGDRLEYYDPHWLGSLKRGTLWLIIAIFAGIALGMVNGLVSAVLQQQQAFNQPAFQPNSPQPTFQQIMQQSAGTPAQLAVAFAFAAISAVLYFIAIWQLTAPEPSKADESPFSSRRLLRWGWIIGAGLGLVGQAVMIPSAIAGSAIALLALPANLIAFFALFIYLRGLARRLPNKSLASQTRTIMWGMVAIMVAFPLLVLAIALLAFASGGGSGVAAIAMIGVCGVLVGGIAALGLYIWGIVLLFFYYGGFARAERRALDARVHAQHLAGQPQY